MLIKARQSWHIKENQVTPEHIYMNRRDIMKAMFGAGLIGAGISSLPSFARAESDPTADLYPAPTNPAYAMDKLDRAVTAEEYASSYNNFYEFGSHKQIASIAQSLETRPWTVTFDGMVENEKTVDIDTLIRAMPIEERYYRHRCVEAWSMTVPWTGFAFKSLVDFAKPLSGAKYVRMETFMNPDVASGQKQSWYPWPYVEGVTMAEATNDLAFLVTGVYGKPAAKQYGAPLRLALPWKYGFKSIKSLVRFTFTDKRPVSFWEEINAGEYGFWANVNPEVRHPRWSQATERVLGTDERVPTLLYNGYGEQVADLYNNMDNEKLFM